MASITKVTGVVCLVGASAGSLVQAMVTPIGSADSGAAQVAAAVAHPDRMVWAAGLDLIVLLLVPALFFVGRLAGAERSRFAAIAYGISFGSVLAACGYLLAMDALVLAASRQADPVGAAAVVDGYTGTGVVTAAVLFFLIGHLVGFVLLAVALGRARAVPVWAAVALGLWPVGEITGTAVDQVWLTALGYALLVAAFGACAAALRTEKSSETTSWVESPLTAGANG